MMGAVHDCMRTVFAEGWNAELNVSGSLWITYVESSPRVGGLLTKQSLHRLPPSDCRSKGTQKADVCLGLRVRREKTINYGRVKLRNPRDEGRQPIVNGTTTRVLRQPHRVQRRGLQNNDQFIVSGSDS